MIAALERLEVSTGDAGEPGRVAVLDLMRARTRRFDAVFVLGLEEGSLPRRGRSSPFLDDDRRRELGARLERPDPVSRDRYLFYTACTRATRRLCLVREAATDDGAPLRGEPVLGRRRAPSSTRTDVARATRRRRALAADAGRSTRRRPSASGCARWRALSADADSADLAARARRRERLDAPAAPRAARVRPADAPAQPGRARGPRDAHDASARPSSSASSTARRPGCSSGVVDPKTIDAEADAMLRGKVAHQALYAFYNGLPKELGTERVTEANLDAALALPRAVPRRRAARRRAASSSATSHAAELREGLRRDLERFVREEARVAARPRCRAGSRCGFGTDRSAPELQRGLELGDGLFVSGKIDRIDIDPLSARGIVQDYKSGKGSFSATQIDDERRLQVPLYMLVLRDLVGIEPLGGVYRALVGLARRARDAPRRRARRPAGLQPARLPRRGGVLGAGRDGASSARARRRGGSARGDVAHDPKGGECPSWCDVWTMCRVARADERAAARGGRGARRGVRLRRRRAPARRRCSSSGSCARCATRGSTSSRCS